MADHDGDGFGVEQRGDGAGGCLAGGGSESLYEPENEAAGDEDRFVLGPADEAEDEGADGAEDEAAEERRALSESARGRMQVRC